MKNTQSYGTSTETGNFGAEGITEMLRRHQTL